MKKLILPLMILTIVLQTGCHYSGNKQETSDENLPEIKPKADVTKMDKRAVAAIDGIVDHYLHVQQALVKSDSTDARVAAGYITDLMGKVDTSQFPEGERANYRQFSGNIFKSADRIMKTQNIGGQRSAFKDLSDNVYGLVKNFGYRKTLYKVHCPMAFNHQGADWLSTENEVRNPYYGNDMLECGTVDEEIRR